jgi:hypothetical protein
MTDEREYEDSHDELVQRLRVMGATPLDAGAAHKVHNRVLGFRASRSGLKTVRWVMAAALAGFVAGSVGLAAADVLPAPAQDAVHNALNVVGVHVPPGHERYNDPAVCPGGPYRNHGEYVRTHKDDPDAGASPCGKPIKSLTKDDKSDGDNRPSTPRTNQGAQKPDKSNKNNNGQGHGKPADDKPNTAPPSTTGSPSTTSPEPPSTVPNTTTSTTTSTIP